MKGFDRHKREEKERNNGKGKENEVRTKFLVSQGGKKKEGGATHVEKRKRSGNSISPKKIFKKHLGNLCRKMTHVYGRNGFKIKNYRKYEY